MSAFTFAKPISETVLQDNVYQEVMTLLATYISEGKTDEDFGRRSLVIKRRCTSQPYASNYENLVAFAAHLRDKAEEIEQAEIARDEKIKEAVMKQSVAK